MKNNRNLINLRIELYLWKHHMEKKIFTKFTIDSISLPEVRFNVFVKFELRRSFQQVTGKGQMIEGKWTYTGITSNRKSPHKTNSKSCWEIFLFRWTPKSFSLIMLPILTYSLLNSIQTHISWNRPFTSSPRMEKGNGTKY